MVFDLCAVIIVLVLGDTTGLRCQDGGVGLVFPSGVPLAPVRVVVNTTAVKLQDVYVAH